MLDTLYIAYQKSKLFDVTDFRCSALDEDGPEFTVVSSNRYPITWLYTSAQITPFLTPSVASCTEVPICTYDMATLIPTGVSIAHLLKGTPISHLVGLELCKAAERLLFFIGRLTAYCYVWEFTRSFTTGWSAVDYAIRPRLIFEHVNYFKILNEYIDSDQRLITSCSFP